MRTALFWVIMQHIVVISYRLFGTAIRFHLQGSRIQKPKLPYSIDPSGVLLNGRQGHLV